MRRSMPWSVRIAAAAVALAVLALATGVVLVLAAPEIRWAQAAQLGLYAALFGVLLAGLLTRRRVAWLWGRFLGFFLFAVALAGVLANASRMRVPEVAALVLGFAGPMLAASLALGRRSAHEWFGLVCPSCGATSSRGDLLLRKVRCRSCGETF